MSEIDPKVSWFWGKPTGLSTWLPKHSTTRWIVGAIALAVLVSLGLWLAGAWSPASDEPPSNHARNIVWIYISAVGGVLGLLLAFQRTTTATQQAATAERGERNSRFQTGAQMIGHEILAVRLGGIYALKALVENDPKTYCGMVTDLFSAFVRNPPHSEAPKRETTDEAETDGDATPPSPPRQDIHVVLDILGNTEWRDLMRTGGLSGGRIRLVGANLSRAYLSGANLSGASLLRADLSGASLPGADLSGTTLWDANLSRADLSGADLDKVKGLTKAQLAQAKGTPKNVPDDLPDE